VRWANATLMLQRLHSGADAGASPAVEGGFRPNDVLQGRWVVRSEPRSGGIANVYRVYDTELYEDFAAKFLQPQYDESEDIDIVDEYKRVENVPPHPNIALPTFIERLRTYARDGTGYPIDTRFMLTRWVAGESLLEELRSTEKIALERAVAITS